MDKSVSKIFVVFCLYIASIHSVILNSDIKPGKILLNVEHYQNKTAKEKQDILYNQVIADKTSGEFSTEKQAQLFVESMNPSFDAPQDTFEGLSGPFGIFGRSKVIHSVGGVAKFTYIPLKNKYTGVFKGCTTGLMRLSTPTAYDSTPLSMVASAAFKFLRDGIPSGNVFAINSLEGRDTFNFFKHDIYSNPIFPSVNISYGGQLIISKFLEASDWLMVGVSDLATYDQQGKREKPIFPFNLVFQGTKYVKSLYTDDFVSSNLPAILARIPANSTVYNVYAEEPNMQTTLIGQIKINTPFTSSNFGDNDLFFQHYRKENDFSLRPEWGPFAQQIVDQQSNAPYFNGPDDLPEGP